MTEEALINNLPTEIFEIILRKIDGSSLGRCRRVCKNWKELIDCSIYLWHEKCQRDFKNASKIAKRKSGNQITWYHIYKNLFQWSDLKELDLETKQLYKFNFVYSPHTFDIDSGILMFNDGATKLYNACTLETLNVTLPHRNCSKIANNDNVTIIQVEQGIFVQRTVNSPDFVTEGFFKADGFVLANNHLFIFLNKDIFAIDLTCHKLTANFIVTVQYTIKGIQYSEHVIYLFTDCGYILSLTLDLNNRFCKTLKYNPINCPVEWIKQIKHIHWVDHKNYLCYSRNLIKIEVDIYKHLYLEFPPITALFFYINIIILGIADGMIVLYRLSCHIPGYQTIFERIARLPNGETATHLEVCERRTGPVIVASTAVGLYVIEIPFFPHEPLITESSFTAEKFNMHRRILKLKERLAMPNISSSDDDVTL